MNFCPKCGFPTESMNYCPKCGFELIEPNIVNVENADFIPDEIDAEVVERTNTGDDVNIYEQSKEDEIRNLRSALIGEKANHYVPIFEDLDKNGGQSWNWCGCLFAPMWFAYRKLYVWAIIAIFAPALIGFLFGFALVAASVGGEVTSVLSRFIGIGCAIVFGVVSNGAYKKRIDKLIAEIPSVDEERKKYIERKGGVSGGGLALALVVYLGFSMLLSLASM